MTKNDKNNIRNIIKSNHKIEKRKWKKKVKKMKNKKDMQNHKIENKKKEMVKSQNWK